jgi:hypothetical protein
MGQSLRQMCPRSRGARSSAAVRSEPRKGLLLDMVRSFVHRDVYGGVAPSTVTRPLSPLLSQSGDNIDHYAMEMARKFSSRRCPNWN